MKIEKDKYYKTRDGRKAYVAGFNPFNKGDEQVLGSIEDYGSTTWLSDGRWLVSPEDMKDLVEEWVDPIVVTSMVYLFKDLDDEYSLTTFTPKVPLASRLITLTEGEFEND